MTLYRPQSWPKHYGPVVKPKTVWSSRPKGSAR